MIENPVQPRRNNIHLIDPSFRTTLFKNSVISVGSNSYNSRPNNIKLLRDCNLQTYILEGEAVV